ncbi:IS630 family transposase [filamentous cyanobacterium LEGE 11480]|uniref:IS630 family transposase n=1 Tax=Romeriopsis navalis LEGE 11480 TaxID=2777977 RepID=A0A928Z4B3_9CYAN|nr:IS630 family transposase [Romeriopsis navalis]MBE9032416.1 IS630 family transposase [Romeriopsis navalis LEGE 11480]
MIGRLHKIRYSPSLAVGVAPDLHLRDWVEDESRFGLKPISRRRITAKGVEPVAVQHWRFKWVWLYGLVEPLTGESCFWEFSHLDHPCFGQVLQCFAQKYPDDMHIIQLDRSSVHRTPKLDKPNNVALLFQPAYCPELNPIEQLWAYLKTQLANRYWFDLEELQQAISQHIRQLTRAGLRSLTQRDFLMEAFDVAGIRLKQLIYP